MKFMVLATSLMFSLTALAHHNYRLKFDDQQEITLTGVVTKFDWKNPHLEIFLDVTDSKGEVTNWVLPTAAPRVAGQNGVDAETLKPGDTLVVTGWPARDGSAEMRARIMTLADGTEYRLWPSRTGNAMGSGMANGMR